LSYRKKWGFRVSGGKNRDQGPPEMHRLCDSEGKKLSEQKLSCYAIKSIR
jgi:hypothetical protein